jgi:hypothetical protein
VFPPPTPVGDGLVVMARAGPFSFSAAYYPAINIVAEQTRSGTFLIQPSLACFVAKRLCFEGSEVNRAPVKAVEPFCEIASTARTLAK